MKKTAVKLVALVATTLLLLSGCSSDSPSVAATVGNERITVAQVDAISKAIAGHSPEEPNWGTWRSAVLQVLLVSKLGNVVKQETGLQVTEVQRKQVYAQNSLYTALAADPATTAFMSDYADITLILNDSSAQQLFEVALGSVPIEVNPLFGTWDATKAQLSGESGSLSKTLS